MTFLLNERKSCFLEDGQYLSQPFQVLLKRLTDDNNIVQVRGEVSLDLRAYQVFHEPLNAVYSRLFLARGIW